MGIAVRGPLFRSLRGLAFALLSGVALMAPAQTLQPDPNFGLIKATSNVTALAVQADGKVLFSGAFTIVNGVPRQKLARLNADGTLDATWTTAFDINGSASAIVIVGTTAYVGGSFSTIGGVARNNLAAVDTATGAVLPWNPNVTGSVSAIAVSGSTVYIGGDFNLVGVTTRNFIAAVDAATGAATSWNPDANGSVYALAIAGTTVYAGGSYANIGTQARKNIAALDATTGVASSWNPIVDNDVLAVSVSGTTTYLGGKFTTVNTLPHAYVAAIDATTGAPTAWNPQLDGVTNTVFQLGGVVYIGGRFSLVGVAPRYQIAAVDVVTGVATPWNPGTPGNRTKSVVAMAVSGSIVYAGGFFNLMAGSTSPAIARIDIATGDFAAGFRTSAGVPGSVLAMVQQGDGKIVVGGDFEFLGATGIPRGNLLRLNADGTLDPVFHPDADRYVGTLATSATAIYAAGIFATIGGQARDGLAAIDIATGNVTGWSPSVPSVQAIAESGSVIFVGGTFNGTFDGQARHGVAALDATTGIVTAWDSQSDGNVFSLAVSGSTLYVGGGFHNIGGQVRNFLAALSTTTGLASTWNPNPDDQIAKIDVNGNTVYVGANFLTHVGAAPRSHFAAIDATTGLATPFAPNPARYPSGVAFSGSTVFVGYPFSAGAQLAAKLDAATGNSLGWNPNPQRLSGGGASVLAVVVAGPTVYLGGVFDTVLGQTRGSLAAVTVIGNPPPAMQGAASRKVHGSAGTFNLPL